MKWDGRRRLTMKRVTACAFILIAIFCCTATAGEYKEMELIDGSTIRGELISFNNGVYQLRTSSLGLIGIEDSKVLMIRSISAHITGGERQANAPASSEIERIPFGLSIR